MQKYCDPRHGDRYQNSAHQITRGRNTFTLKLRHPCSANSRSAACSTACLEARLRLGPTCRLPDALLEEEFALMTVSPANRRLERPQR